MSDINKHTIQKIGKSIRLRREQISLSQKDVANMTGLTVNTISAFENGSSTTLNNFLLICRALQIQPREIFASDIDLTPPFNLPPATKKRIEITQKLDELVYNTDFFDTPRRVAEVLEEMDADKRDSNKFSVYLSGYCKEEALEYQKEGNIKRYKRKRS